MILNYLIVCLLFNVNFYWFSYIKKSLKNLIYYFVFSILILLLLVYLYVCFYVNMGFVYGFGGIWGLVFIIINKFFILLMLR